MLHHHHRSGPSSGLGLALALLALLAMVFFGGGRHSRRWWHRSWRTAVHGPVTPRRMTPPNGGVPLQPPEGFLLGEGDQRVFVNYASPDPVLRSLLQSVMTGSSDPEVRGREIFARICTACHQRDGDGKEGVAPSLLGSDWVLAPKGDRLVRLVINGMTGPVTVRGTTWNLAMPPWRANLDDEQVAEVLTFIRGHLGPNQAGPITAAMVAAARQESRAVPETATSLLRVPDR